MLQILNNLFDTGVYDQLYKAGLMPAKLSIYRDYCLYVDLLIKTRHLSKTKAVKETAGFYNVDERCIWRALKAIPN